MYDRKYFSHFFLISVPTGHPKTAERKRRRWQRRRRPATVPPHRTSRYVPSQTHSRRPLIPRYIDLGRTVILPSLSAPVQEPGLCQKRQSADEEPQDHPQPRARTGTPRAREEEAREAREHDGRRRPAPPPTPAYARGRYSQLCVDFLLSSILTHGTTDTSIEAPPSVLPPRHYCDITGLEVSLSWILTNHASHIFVRPRIRTLRPGFGTTIKAYMNISKRWCVAEQLFLGRSLTLASAASKRRERLSGSPWRQPDCQMRHTSQY